MRLRERWSQEGGYREVLKVAVPLILSTGSWSIQHFVDRVFLTWYSREALAAALPAGMLSFTFASFFMGTASYVNTFVAQYTGAGRPAQVGRSMWQGIYFGLLAGLFMMGLYPFAAQIFDWVGHDPGVRALEVTYFRIMCIGGFNIAGAALSAFFTGRGKTMTVMWVNFAVTALNIVLDYAWIFGHWGFPRWGIEGAAWATVIARVFGTAIFVVLIFRSENRRRFNTLGGWRPNPALFRRLMRFGLPNGVQFMLEILAFSMFIMLVGRLGAVELAATNIASNINTLAFLPMLGVGIAVSTLVGRHLGEDRPDLAEQSTWSAFHLATLYMGVMATGYVLLPHLFLMPFASGADAESFAPVWRVCVVLLRFVAVYSLLDGMYIVFSAGVKGAGDTRFVMMVSLLLSWTIMVIPVYLAVTYGRSLYLAWTFTSAYIVIIGIVFLFRFRGGKWKSMRVIETEGEFEAIMAQDSEAPVV